MSGSGRAVLALAAMATAACTPGMQSAVHPRGPDASLIVTLYWLFLVVSAIVMAGVIGGTWLALFRRGRVALDGDPPDHEPGKVAVVTGLTIATSVILFVLLVASVYVSGVTSSEPRPEERPVTITVIGHQWWWEFRYEDEQPNRRFTTANELHIPVGRPVILRMTSRDVIHSFWVPNLHGKMDLMAGRFNTLRIRADQPGEYRGQCAEFCGLQHAKMAFVVVAEPEAQYHAWVERYLQPAAEPEGALAQQGREVFLQLQCSLCHTIRGTGAWGRVAPDLTRIGARRTIGAGTLPNTRGNLAGWLLDPQHVKPGSFMPPTQMQPEQLHALLAYLEGLR
jgi:cytochrome c oxidase subunit II